MKNKIVRALMLFAVSLTMNAAKLPTEKQQQDHLSKVERKWAVKLGVTTPVSLSVSSEADLLQVWLSLGGEYRGMLYGCSGANEEGSFIGVMRLQDYPAWANVHKIKKDQENTVIHELVHILGHQRNEENFVTRIADLLAK